MNINLLELIPVADCKARHSEDGLELDGMGYVRTKDIYKVPLKITVIAKTDSSNIRLHYGKGQVILLWEEDATIVPLHEPIFGHDHKIRNVRGLNANEWIKCVWTLTNNSIRIEINDEELFYHNSNNEVITLGSGMPWIIPHLKDLISIVGIGPAWGSIITIKDLQIEEYDEYL